MLANLLAIVVGLGSFAFYMAAFFFPEVHRKSDFLWSGVGLFYGLVLWFCAGQIKGAVLLGQTASVSLLIWFGWQTLQMRRVNTPLAQQTPISFSKNRLRVESVAPRHRTDLEYEFVEDADSPIPKVDPITETKDLGQFTEPDGADTRPIPTSIAKSSESSTSDIDAEGRHKALPLQSSDNSLDSSNINSSVNEVSQIESGVSSAPSASSAPSGIFGKVFIIVDWLKDLATSFTQPKAPKPMIELPPRPPSIPRSTETAQTQAKGNELIRTEEAEGKETETSGEESQLRADDDTDSPIENSAESDLPETSLENPSASSTPSGPWPSDIEVSSRDKDSLTEGQASTTSDAQSQSVEKAETENWPNEDEDANWPDDDFFD